MSDWQPQEPDKPKCPKCGTDMEPRSALGYDRHGREMECDWSECPKCGHQDSSL